MAKLEVGKKYYFQNKGGTILHGTFERCTTAWNIFTLDSGKEFWSDCFSYFETLDELKLVNGIVECMKHEIHIPDVVHLPNANTR